MSKLEQLYQEMADLTLPKCKECRCPLSCCSTEYCHMAIDYAAEKGITLTPTGVNPMLPLMGNDGCVAPPHLRPLCTMHVCSINNLGFDPKDRVFTKKYFQIRRLIEKEEFRLAVAAGKLKSLPIVHFNPPVTGRLSSRETNLKPADSKEAKK